VKQRIAASHGPNARRLEGVVSKRAGAPYRSGRGHDWIKSKCTQRQEFVIVGYTRQRLRGGIWARLSLAIATGNPQARGARRDRIYRALRRRSQDPA